MNLNVIKKALYKEKPIAKLVDDGLSGIRGSSAVSYKTYKAKTSIGVFTFAVPYHEMGDTIFEDELPAQLLIRWILLITNSLAITLGCFNFTYLL